MPVVLSAPHWRFTLSEGESYVCAEQPGGFYTAELRTAALCAIGDPGEDAQAVADALAGAVCELWCCVALDPEAKHDPDGMVWSVSELGQAIGLLECLATVDRTHATAAGHRCAPRALKRYDTSQLGVVERHLRDQMKANGIFGSGR